jgi:hypothetical protein
MESETARSAVLPERELALDRASTEVLLGCEPADDPMGRQMAVEQVRIAVSLRCTRI